MFYNFLGPLKMVMVGCAFEMQNIVLNMHNNFHSDVSVSKGDITLSGILYFSSLL